MTASVRAFAPAKVNLTLHVTGQRPDGYHLLDSLVAFADIGDHISAKNADETSVTVSGPRAAGVPTDARNLMVKAAHLMDSERPVALSLEKTLPAASGIGGGSSDAAATLRALAELWDVPMPDASDTLVLGADLPVCLAPGPQRMAGIGEQITPLPPLPACDILLVNPGVHVATPSIFKALGSRDNAPMPAQLPVWETAADLADWLSTQRNDLEPPAVATAPVISDVLAELSAAEGVLLARMSGSGATCFALFESESPDIEDAAKSIASRHPEWWVQAGKLFNPA